MPEFIAKARAHARQLVADVAIWLRVIADPACPWHVRIIVGVAIAYALSPIDFIPDFIPVLGWLDELIVLPALFALAAKATPPALLLRHRDAPQAQVESRSRAFGMVGMIAIIALWALLAWAVLLNAH
jgi:uncharacterized membrane protein YkvA (DUF1232 family)